MSKTICKTIEFCMILLALFGLQGLLFTGIYMGVLPLTEEPLTLLYLAPTFGILTLGGIRLPGIMRRGE